MIVPPMSCVSLEHTTKNVTLDFREQFSSVPILVALPQQYIVEMHDFVTIKLKNFILGYL